jgi:hypothetical protein
MSDQMVRIHKKILRANLNSVFMGHDDSYRQSFAGSGRPVQRQPTNWADASHDQSMLEREIGAMPDELPLPELIAKVGALLKACRSEAWQTCPPESVAKYIAS